VKATPYDNEALLKAMKMPGTIIPVDDEKLPW
jgi:hypothetical protein